MDSFCRIWIPCVFALLFLQAAEANNTQTFGVNAYLSEGARAMQLGDFAKGIQLTLEGLKSESLPSHRARGLNNLCAGYIAMRQYDEAIISCDEALKIDARNWRIYNNRALAHLGEGRIDAAKRDVKKGMSLNPESLLIYKVDAMIRAQDRSLLTATDGLILRPSKISCRPHLRAVILSRAPMTGMIIAI